jgi:cell division protein FtsI (penicillin-binding protein 3)
MAPADAPRLVVAVSIMNPRVGRYGGELGAPVFKRVMTYALQARQIPPTGAKPSRLPLTYG